MPHSQKNLYKKLLGGRGERAALKFLKKQGYRPVLRNYSTPFGEVDLIVRKGEILAFVEVKTRTRTDYGTPSQAVDKLKRERYRRAAAFCLKTEFLGEEELSVRFDVIEVFPFGLPESVTVGVEKNSETACKKGKTAVRHIPAAFL